MIPHYHRTKAQEKQPKPTLVESSGWEHQSTTFTLWSTKTTIPLSPAIHPSAFSWKNHSSHFPGAIFVVRKVSTACTSLSVFLPHALSCFLSDTGHNNLLLWNSTQEYHLCVDIYLSSQSQMAGNTCQRGLTKNSDSEAAPSSIWISFKSDFSFSHSYHSMSGCKHTACSGDVFARKSTDFTVKWFTANMQHILQPC